MNFDCGMPPAATAQSITRAIIVAFASGRSATQVAESLDVSPALVQYIVDSPLARAEIGRLEAMYTSETGVRYASP